MSDISADLRSSQPGGSRRPMTITLPDGVGNRIAVEANQQRWGGNLGGGMFAYYNRFGVRGDVRWYRSSGGGEVLNSDTFADDAA